MALYLSPEPVASTVLLVDGRVGWFEAEATPKGMVVHIAAYTHARIEGDAPLDKDITVRLVSQGGPLSVADVTLHGRTAGDHPDLIAFVLKALGDADHTGSIDQHDLISALSERLHAGLPAALSHH